MKICILGWYGTETLGDRAILDGIICIFERFNVGNTYHIGSLYPILTQRTIAADQSLYKAHAKNLSVSSFDVRDKETLKSEIEYADMVIMGGGPLMDLPQLYMLDFAFRYAKKQNKMTALFGCGYGPLCRAEYKDVVKSIIKNSDLIIMRSEVCKQQIGMLMNSLRRKPVSLCDPAIISVLEYKERHHPSPEKSNSWIVNVRDLDYTYNSASQFYCRVKNIVHSCATQLPSVTLMPMHTFSVGGDDRYIQNRIKEDLNAHNIEVLNKPLTLEEAYSTVARAQGCVGMRYHSIVFHTFLNGNNYIIDYTDAKTGKTIAFLKYHGLWEMYKNKYTNIKESNAELHFEHQLPYVSNIELKDDNIRRYCKLLEHLAEAKR